MPDKLFSDDLLDNAFTRAQQGKSIVIVGGGFYGCFLALYFNRCGANVTMLEAGRELLTRASYNNQARVHQGYHYPRSIITGIRCVANFQRFCNAFKPAVVNDFTKIYPIAKKNSNVTANQFAGFCERIGAPLKTAKPEIKSLFDRDLIEDVFEVREYAFNALALREFFLQELQKTNIQVRFESRARSVSPSTTGSRLELQLQSDEKLSADDVYCCTYSQLNVLLRNSNLPHLPLKHEIAEMALVRTPPILHKLGITIMDGPFFSLMPFPAEQLHSLSHVRYTPHEGWFDSAYERDPQAYLASAQWKSHFPQMLKDASRYLPLVKSCEYVHSLFEVKTVLVKNERNDGRPILLRRNYGLPGLHTIMGGKIDNIFDICQALANCGETAEPALA